MYAFLQEFQSMTGKQYLKVLSIPIMKSEVTGQSQGSILFNVARFHCMPHDYASMQFMFVLELTACWTAYSTQKTQFSCSQI